MSYDIVAVGCSLGGLKALMDIVCPLPDHFPLPIVVVQHRASDADDEALVELLRSRCTLRFETVEDKAPVHPSTVYLAPADYHVLVDEEGFALSTQERLHFSRPSIDVLFSSVADTYGPRAIGVLLTGASGDGAQGLLEMRKAGGFTIVQDPDQATSPVMPRAAIRIGAAEQVAATADIGPLLEKLAGEGRR